MNEQDQIKELNSKYEFYKDLYEKELNKNTELIIGINFKRIGKLIFFK